MRGDVVVVHFPFSDLSQSKRRPALVVAELSGNDLILCQVTSRARIDPYSISLEGSDFQSGGLNRPSMIKPNRLFTADSSIVLYRVGSVRLEKLGQVVEALIRILRT